MFMRFTSKMSLAVPFVSALAIALRTSLRLGFARFMLLGLIVSFSAPVVGFCECGYVAGITANSVTNPYVFTDLIESDFMHVNNIKIDTDWSIQSYNVSATAARGPYG